MRRLYKAFLTLKTEEECAAFLDDICTIKELQDLSQRLEAAIMLNDGQNYQYISKQVGTIEQIDEQTRRMAQQIEELNNVYARMIGALTINMGNVPPAAQSEK